MVSDAACGSSLLRTMLHTQGCRILHPAACAGFLVAQPTAFSENVSTATESCMRGLAKHTWVGLIPSRWNQPMVPARCACIAVSAYAKCSQCNPSMGGTSNARPLHHSTQHTALFSLDINLILNAAHRTCFGCCTTHIGTLANQLMFNRSGLLHSTMPSQCTSHIEQ